MCGILGVIKNGSGSDSIHQAFNAIMHRGPDHSGKYEDDIIFLGNHRLKIQDLSDDANQPFTDPTGRYTIIYNGEIYNHKEIRKDLAYQQISFKTTSDTETILLGFIKHGEKILEQLNGIFAFCIYDHLEQKLFCARDQLGVKPFYYFLKGDCFAFSSELKSLIYLDQFDRTLNYKAFLNYLNFLWSPGEITPFQYVFKLLPGEYFTIDVKNPADTFRKKMYYSIPFTGAREFYNDKVWIDTIDRKLSSAVERQLLSDVPIGFFLSGGIDSSLIVAAARRLHPDRQIDCYTIQHNENTKLEGFKDDFKYAKQVAKHLNVNLHVVDGGISVIKNFDKMIWHLDEPQADIAPLYVYKVCETARNDGIKVLLSGAGGDDVFSGYRRHQALYYDKYLQHAPKFIIPLIEKFIQNKNPNNPTIRRIGKMLKRKSGGQLHKLIGYFEWYPATEHLDLFNKDIAHEMEGYHPDNYLNQLLVQIPDENELLNKMLYLELKTFLVDHNLNYTDKMGMACGVEVRVPFIDRDLVKTSTKMPVDLKLRRNTTKYVLRKVGERYLPAEIIHRSKTGFGAPVRNWIKQGFENMINDRLHAEQLNVNRIFNPQALTKLINDNKQGKIDASYTILTIMAIESWLDQFYKKS